MEWKTRDGCYENTAYAQFDTFYQGMFQRERLLDILKGEILHLHAVLKIPCKSPVLLHQTAAVKVFQL